MVEREYAIAYSEVLEILKYISKEDYNKIPTEKLNVFITNASKDYQFEYNPEKTLDEQNVSKRAKAIIGLLFRDYWSTETQRKKIIEKQNYDRMQIEKHKQEEYRTEDIFKNRKQNNPQVENDVSNNMAMVEYKESIFKKIIEKIKKIFKR